ncbi:transcription initiation factor tfiid, putative [Ichthyophthirius multifiliis]|uniref:Transcription initiation factor tfiid, putative n=1 Tax=Ichthyophthirius multifiliis TaxID=5932 RepID=G0R157_ICHMU|nr:transcription initiation factor tfiid, putative [Ichthyophthirius multifiliis]EGR28824.1 transcription initiation factor tfiid, putative [Ichthyophthirius multifiliis]|eukprot:XP_004030060.1 transcription initiation factor tfiid, putative [Ichthyophthirius multifiliis]
MVQDFLERKNLDNPNTYPNILNIRIDDANDIITCIEISRSSNIILCGTEDSQILLYDLYYQESFSENQSMIQNIFDNMQNTSQKDPLIKLKSKFQGHEDTITSLSILYNENFFISSSTDLSIRLWDIRMVVCIQIFKGHLSTIWQCKFAHQGFLFASCSADNTAIIWSTNSIYPHRVFVGHSRDVILAEFSFSLSHLITAGLDFVVKFWKIKTSQCVLSVQFASQITALKISYSGAYLVIGQENGDIRIWDLINVEQEKCVHIQNIFSRDPIRFVDISFDENTVIAGTDKLLAYYYVQDFKSNTGNDVYEDFYIGEQEFIQKMNDQRFDGIEPKEIFEIQKIKSEKYLRAQMHNRNFILAISKQSNIN